MTLLADQAQQQADTLSVKGRIRRRDEDELLLMALLLLGDIELAASEWSRLADDKYKGLALAQRASPDFPDIPEARATATAPAFDPRTLQYVRRLGDVIPAEAVRLAALRAIAKAQAEFLRETVSMEFGAKELEDWFIDMVARVKRLHLALAIVGVGGKLQLPPAQLVTTSDTIPTDLAEAETIADSIAFHVARLYRFAIEIELRAHGTDSAQAIENRAKLYASSAYGGYMDGTRVAAAFAGFTQEQNVLDEEAEHCLPAPGDTLPNCPELSEMGWVKLGSLPKIGARKCRMNCRCHFDFK